MLRFDYNIVISLGLLLYFEYQTTHVMQRNKEVGLCLHKASYLCLACCIVDIIWIFIYMFSWILSSPDGVLENKIFGKLLIWRLMVYVAAIGSVGLKV